MVRVLIVVAMFAVFGPPLVIMLLGGIKNVRDGAPADSADTVG